MSCRVIYLLLTLFIGLSAGSGCLRAAGVELRVMTEEFPPFNYMDGARLTGLSTRIVKALLTESRLNHKIELVPWKRAYMTALKRPNTLIYTIARTEERAHQFHWIGKLANRKVSLFRLEKRSDLATLTLAAARQTATIACPQGDASTERLIQMGFSPDNLTIIHDVPSGNLIVKHVIKERSDFFPMNPYTLKFRVENNSLPDIFKEQFVIYDADGYYIAANIDTDPEILRVLRGSYQKLMNNGFIEKTIDHYLNF